MKQLHSRILYSLSLPMACQALTNSNKQCRNWSCVDSKYCSSHQDYSPEVHKERWFKRYILGQGSFPFHYRFSPLSMRKVIEEPLRRGEIVLTKQDILRIPVRDWYIDTFLLLVSLGVLNPSDHDQLYNQSLRYYYRVTATGLDQRHVATCREIEQTLIAPSGERLFQYFKDIPKLHLRIRDYLFPFFIRSVTGLLDTDGAKELSWQSRETLDTLRVLYENELGADHPFTKALVQRWLPDLKELYATEKAIQKVKMDQCKEELMMNRWHPDRVWTYLNMGLDIDDM